ncbi:HD domain-containing phosphohydrolase [Paeniglutamicibacter sulfureus]|uniref:HD-GYP domain-containing protein (C-di-GMP phosphodiesterase class II)/DNA-binding CsgD family transcriptional regulator n=2 Tax=Paeniglutamicibacter TaxID=1742990 RepID=A0ABU2BJL6_9MICC|nr:HD domain-containing phosphohydrolase [Paeniglutamicibacter sulfureus]MDO2933729.1 HD domain-containing phosphohydrolase [Paeniglutamicibacter sulfureus]MDR7358169.1 HD-GYP domain-containing protein (c-di-GMP phosphodiesterase class II)/DNA-binding CsgD family transcriptional regulator [Paeniglutamicibacter sulfureus]
MADQGARGFDRIPAVTGSAGSAARAGAGAPRRSELLAALSLAIDLGLGQPMEHMMRATLLGLRIAEQLGVDKPARERIYHANLLAWIGCHADSFELAALFDDDIAFRSDYYLIDAQGLPMLSLMLRHTGSQHAGGRRVLERARFALGAKTAVRDLIASHCTSAGQLAARVGLDGDLPSILAHTFERWDGLGLPAGKSGTQIPLEMRIAQLADAAEVFLRSGGIDAAVAMVAARRGTQFDPEIADLFCARAPELSRGLMLGDPWPAVLASAPADEPLDAAGLDSVLEAMGDFADLKSPWTTGHSRAVATLAAAAAGRLGLDPVETVVLRRSGWVHDLGRMGVSNAVWDKPGPLSAVELEHLAMYPFLTERILARVPGMRRVAEVAGAHRERLDGSGYPQGRTGSELDPTQRLLAAAEAHQTYLEPRPHREALGPRAAGERLRSEAAAGRLDASAVDAVLAAAGTPLAHRRRSAGPAGLTGREIEVLRLLCRGMDNRRIAAALVIAPKTARNHVEHIYLKIGASNRVSATLFALEHGLWDRGHGTAPR